MGSTFEVQLSPEYLAKIEADLEGHVRLLASQNAFTAYNRGGGPKDNYDRHYDKSTGRLEPSSSDAGLAASSPSP